MTGTYYEKSELRAEKVGQLFTRIAPRYDLLNDLQSLGLHRRWKRRAVELAAPRPGERVLDLACGTGDLLRIGKRRWPESHWIGMDFNCAMLREAGSVAPLAQADALELPVKDGSFSAVTIAYGLRNLADRGRALSGIRRALKPGGRLVSLDFAKPPCRLVRGAYFTSLRMIQPVLGAVFFGDPETYRYICRSLETYPEIEELSAEFRAAGFGRVSALPFIAGTMCIHVATL